MLLKETASDAEGCLLNQLRGNARCEWGVTALVVEAPRPLFPRFHITLCIRESGTTLLSWSAQPVDMLPYYPSMVGHDYGGAESAVYA